MALHSTGNIAINSSLETGVYFMRQPSETTLFPQQILMYI